MGAEGGGGPNREGGHSPSWINLDSSKELGGYGFSAMADNTGCTKTTATTQGVVKLIDKVTLVIV